MSLRFQATQEIRFKYIATFQKGKIPAEFFETDGENRLPYLSMEYLRDQSDAPQYALAEGSLVANTGNVLLLWDGANAGEFILAKTGIVSSTAALVSSSGVNNRFLFYLCKHIEPRIRAQTVGMGIPHVNGDFVQNLIVKIPDELTQEKIANFLDNKISEVDTLIAAKERLLELLAGKRRAVITHAVTRGLNASVSLRDSGVEWLGEIPSHWKKVKIKQIAQVGNGSTPFREKLEYWLNGSYPWLTSTVVNNEVVEEPVEFVTEIALKECHLPIVQPNSILVAITGQGKTRGKAAILRYEATINQHIAFISPDFKLVTPEYLQLFLSSVYEILRMISEGTGSTKGALTCEQLGEFTILLPSLQEQQGIVDYISEQTSRIDELSLKAQLTIDLLRERREALIAEAVSGQIQVA